MTILLQCHCGHQLSLEDHLAGRQVHCAQCQHPLLVPAAAAEPTPPPLPGEVANEVADVVVVEVAAPAPVVIDTSGTSGRSFGRPGRARWRTARGKSTMMPVTVMAAVASLAGLQVWRLVAFFTLRHDPQLEVLLGVHLVAGLAVAPALLAGLMYRHRLAWRLAILCGYLGIMASVSMWFTLAGAWKGGYILTTFGPFAGLQALTIVCLWLRPSRRWFGLICPRCQGLGKVAGWLGERGRCWLCDEEWQ